MAVGTQPKTSRNAKLVTFKDTPGKTGKKPTFDVVAVRFGVSVARAKEIYYREKPRIIN